MLQPVVSVIVLNYNGLQDNYLPLCLDSLIHQTYPAVQIIVVDNASKDHSLEYIASHYPKIEVLRNPENYGFCLGNNLGYQFANGDYILFANNDTIFAPDCFEKLVRAAKTSIDIGAVSPKLVRPLTDCRIGRILDSAGLTMRRDFTLIDRGIGKIDLGQFDTPVYLFGVCGAAAFFTREAIEAARHVEGDVWDIDFEYYFEDGDLAWRLQNLGFRCLYCPEAIVEHYRGGSAASTFFNKSLPFKVHTIKNRYLMMVKNITAGLFWRHLPFILAREILIWGYLILHPDLFVKVFEALRVTIPSAYSKRKRLRPVGSRKVIMNTYEFKANNDDTGHTYS